MENFANQEIFIKFQDHINKEQELREQIRLIVRELEQNAKEATILLQIIHTDIDKISGACEGVKQRFQQCKSCYSQISEIIPTGMYYRYNDHWTFITQRLVFLVSLAQYLENDTLVSREEAADTLGLKVSQKDGFHLDIEDYLMGILQLASELSRFATNSVTLGDYNRPLKISRFVADLNSGFRLLNLKNDGLRKRYDALKYDVKKIEEVVYDISIRGLITQNQNEVDQA